MTTRPGGATLLDLRFRRAKQVCMLIRITRVDGFVIRLTDHDRALTYEGQIFQPAIAAHLSSDRREAALRSGDQEASGIIDGAVIKIPDLLGNKYRGAMVEMIQTHWNEPWRWIGKHRKWIRTVTHTGSMWIGKLEGRSQLLQRSTGGPLSGTWSPTCTYILGDPLTCRKDISIGSGFAGAGAAVGTILVQKKLIRFTVGTWPGAFTDQYFRDGSFEWRWSAAVVTGTNTSITGDNSLTDTTKTWVTNEHVGRWVRVLTGAGAGVNGAAFAKITANTLTQVFYDTTVPMSGFGAGTNYDIVPECANFGEVSPIIGYLHANREVELFLPTPFNIVVGDSGIWTAGCDGLLSTCGGKFADADHPKNHGGDPLAPSAQQILEPPEVM